jgi:hypothetical protein
MSGAGWSTDTQWVNLPGHSGCERKFAENDKMNTKKLVKYK